MIWSLAPVQGLWIFHDVLRFWSQSVQVHLVHPLKGVSALSICQFKHEILFNEIYHLYCNCMIIRRGYVFTGLRSRERQFIFIRWHLFFKTISKKQWTGQWMSSKKKKSQKKTFFKKQKINSWIVSTYSWILFWDFSTYLWILSWDFDTEKLWSCDSRKQWKLINSRVLRDIMTRTDLNVIDILSCSKSWAIALLATLFVPESIWLVVVNDSCWWLWSVFFRHFMFLTYIGLIPCKSTEIQEV